MSLDESGGTGLPLRGVGIVKAQPHWQSNSDSAHTRTGSGTWCWTSTWSIPLRGEWLVRETSHLVLGGHLTLGKACVERKSVLIYFLFWKTHLFLVGVGFLHVRLL